MTTEVRSTFSQFIDLLLARLYDAQRQNPGGMIDLNEIAADLKESAPEDWVVDAARVMQARGLADCIISYGACRARLTGEGMLFVEEERGTGAIRQYRQEPGQFFQHVSVTGTGNQVVLGTGQKEISHSSSVEHEREPVFRVLGEIEVAIKHEGSLGPAEREDLLADLASLRQQLRKREPNQSAIAALLAPMSHIATVATRVATLIKMLTPAA